VLADVVERIIALMAAGVQLDFDEAEERARVDFAVVAQV
jgi:hypothetical protein